MKKIAIILTLAVLLIAVLPCALVIAQSNHTSHENPATAQTSYDVSLSILLHYGDILDLLASGEYGNIDALIEELDLDRADIPEDIKSVMQTYNGLLSDLAAQLDNLDALLDEAKQLLNQNKLEEAHLKIVSGGELVEEIKDLMEDLDAANEQLLSLLGPLSSIVEVDAVNESRARLLEAIERLKALKARYEILLQEIEGEVTQLMQVSLPDIILETDKSQAWVGDSIILSGMLIEGEQPLANRKITILLNDVAIATTTTDEDGQYQTGADEIKIPYLYISTMTVQTSYIPEGDDATKYSSSFSPVVEIEVQFYSTELTLNLDNANPWVGDTVTVAGLLISPDEADSTLSDRDIVILLDGVKVDMVTTGVDGAYQGVVDVPYEYITSRTIQAKYISGGKYHSCLSDSVDINISFYQTQLQIETPEQIYPGLPFEISGELIYDNDVPLVDRVISVLWDNETFNTFNLSQADFEMEVLLDAETTVGEHLLTVIVNSQGRYRDISADKIIDIIKHVPEIEVQGTSFTTLSRKVKIEGELVSDLPLQGAVVTIELRGESTTVTTSVDGKFEAVLSLPLDSIVMGNQEVKITVEPSEAWHSPTEVEVEVFVVDIVNIGLASAAFICIGLVLYTTRRGRSGKGGVSVLEPLFLPQEPPGIPLHEPEELKDTRAKVFKTYTGVVRMVEASTGVSMKSHMTLREFLDEAIPGLNNAAEPFTELTHLAEDALYSSDMPEADEAARAEKLARTVKEML